jgi:hypothetical protein
MAFPTVIPWPIVPIPTERIIASAGQDTPVTGLSAWMSMNVWRMRITVPTTQVASMKLARLFACAMQVTRAMGSRVLTLMNVLLEQTHVGKTRDVKIRTVPMNANAMKDSKEMVEHAQMSMNVFKIHVMKMHFVPIVLDPINANVLTDSMVMDRTVVTLTNVNRMPPFVVVWIVTIQLAASHAIAKQDMWNLVTAVKISMNVKRALKHVISMQNV